MAAEHPEQKRSRFVGDPTDLAKLVEELREAVRARDTFLDIAAHELRNPMGALLMQVERTLDAARRTGDANLIRQLERTGDVVNRYIRRATTLLDISRINAGKLHLDCKPMDFAEVVRDVTEAYAAEADYLRTELRVCTPGSLAVVSDPLALEQITGNLVSNALKYGAGAPVDVALNNQGAAAHLSVTDRGIGMSDEDRARIFQRFERLFAGPQRAGFGIGLWVVRQLVEALGGEIAVVSAPGEGSTFTVSLPLGAASSQPENS
ncbi:MAG TPA: HAMP domain-containing sensor histidine kinase [Pseudolabrys sp.]|nr:HAMP domain-containing sensor histidine kinase [Pseudolabrys sp.]